MREVLWEEEKLKRISIHPATETSKAKRPVPGLEGSLFFIFGDAVVFALLFGAFAHDYKSNYAIFSQSQSHLNPEIAITNMLVLLISSGLVVLSLNYAMNVEGYQGLVVHGPLTASLLAKFARGFVQKPLKSFSFRGLSPLFDGAPFSLEAKWSEDKLDVWARQPLGGLAMQASATFFD